MPSKARLENFIPRTLKYVKPRPKAKISTASLYLLRYDMLSEARL